MKALAYSGRVFHKDGPNAKKDPEPVVLSLVQRIRRKRRSDAECETECKFDESLEQGQ